MMLVKADSRIFARSFQPAASPKALTRISGDIRSLALKDRQRFRGKKFSALAFTPNQVDDAEKINAPSPQATGAHTSLEAKGGALGGRLETREKIRAAFERAGIDFLDDGGRGVRLQKAKRKAK
jgi:hypothetical protein